MILVTLSWGVLEHLQKIEKLVEFPLEKNPKILVQKKSFVEKKTPACVCIYILLVCSIEPFRKFLKKIILKKFLNSFLK
jgi:hypothetical protein